jgi:hypothetical protein
MNGVPDFVGDRRGFDEEVVRSVGPALARPLQVDDRVNQHVDHVYAFWSELPGDGSRENPLSGLGRRETSEVRLAAEGRGVAAGDDCAWPASIIAGVSRGARCSWAMVFTRKLRFRPRDRFP